MLGEAMHNRNINHSRFKNANVSCNTVTLHTIKLQNSYHIDNGVISQGTCQNP